MQISCSVMGVKLGSLMYFLLHGIKIAQQKPIKNKQ